jgi:hypothetical protein
MLFDDALLEMDFGIMHMERLTHPYIMPKLDFIIL